MWEEVREEQGAEEVEVEGGKEVDVEEEEEDKEQVVPAGRALVLRPQYRE